MDAKGATIDRSTLARSAGYAASLLDPIFNRLRELGCARTKLHTNDTRLPILAPGNGKTHKGALWVYVADDTGSGSKEPSIAWYRATMGRAGESVMNELVGIQAIYSIEEEIRGLPPAERLAARRARTRPIVRALRRQLTRMSKGLSRHAEIVKAFAYGTKRWRAFNRFLFDGQLEPDNLIAEHAIRPVAISQTFCPCRARRCRLVSMASIFRAYCAVRVYRGAGERQSRPHCGEPRRSHRNIGGRPTRNEQFRQRSQNVFVLELAGDDQCETFPTGFVDDGEDAELPTIMGAALNEVIGPDMPRIFRAQPDARSVVEPQSAPLGLLLRYLQSLTPPDAFDPLAVHHSSG